jgi:hypothetical protein
MPADPLTKTPPVSRPLPEKLFFDYIKSNDFRVIHADGAFGGLTPQGLVFVTLYAERPPIPTRIGYTVAQDGQGHIKLGDELKEERVCRDGIVRDLEVGVMMSVAVAESLRDWLSVRIAQARETFETAPAAQEGEDTK